MVIGFLMFVGFFFCTRTAEIHIDLGVSCSSYIQLPSWLRLHKLERTSWEKHSTLLVSLEVGIHAVNLAGRETAYGSGHHSYVSSTHNLDTQCPTLIWCFSLWTSRTFNSRCYPDIPLSSNTHTNTICEFRTNNKLTLSFSFDSICVLTTCATNVKGQLLSYIIKGIKKVYTIG